MSVSALSCLFPLPLLLKCTIEFGQTFDEIAAEIRRSSLVYRKYDAIGPPRDVGDFPPLFVAPTAGGTLLRRFDCQPFNKEIKSIIRRSQP